MAASSAVVRVLASLGLAGVAFSAASCGSRTGLFLDDDLAGGGRVDAAADSAVPCKDGEFAFELAVTQLMFVIDRSGSMSFSLDGDDEAPRGAWRWTALANALRQTITSFDGEIAMGAKFFPEPLDRRDNADAARACRVDTGVGISPALGNASTILSVFDRTTPLGGTPTAEAVRSAASFLRGTRSVARAIVLATDGAPNCNAGLDPEICRCTSQASCTADPDLGRYSCLDDARAIDSVRRTATTDRIPVYVIGIGSNEDPEFFDVLEQMAVAGGRARATAPRHYPAQSESDLTSALTTIRDSVARCTYLTPSAPTDPDDIAVQIDGQRIPRDVSKQNGWDWVDREYGEIAFFGPACERAQGAASRAAAVSGVVRCER